MSDYPIEKNPIRVLQIIGIVCGGGVEAVIMNYYRHIDRTKIQFDFVVDGFERTPLDDEVESMGGKVYHVTPYKKNIFQYVIDIYHIVSENGYEIVHSNMNTLAGFSLFAACLAGAKIRIIHNHSIAGKTEGVRSCLKYALRPFAPLFATTYAACSEAAGEWMYGKDWMTNGKVTVIRNASLLKDFKYDEAMRAKLRNEMHIPKDALVIGHVGRFTYAKNHLFLIEIFDEIRKKEKNAILLLAGDGEERDKIEDKILKLKLNNCVKLLGIRHDVDKLYNIMDLFIFPSVYEGFGMAALEAQVNGLPCFFSDRLPREVSISSRTKFLSLNSTAAQWAMQILGSELERKAPEVADRYDIQQEACKLENFYFACMEHTKHTECI